jgi:hypothetical protein
MRRSEASEPKSDSSSSKKADIKPEEEGILSSDEEDGASVSIQEK